MSKLDEIFKPVYAGSSDDDSVSKAKEDIKALMLELIGEDETEGVPGLMKKNVRNNLRAELRKKVEEL